MAGSFYEQCLSISRTTVQPGDCQEINIDKLYYCTHIFYFVLFQQEMLRDMRSKTEKISIFFCYTTQTSNKTRNMFRTTPRWPPTLTSDSASRQPRRQLGRNHRTRMKAATPPTREEKIETRAVETKEESATSSAAYKILQLKESAPQWLQRRYQVELGETAVQAPKLGDHQFYPKRKSLSSPLSKWCVFCGLHKDMHKEWHGAEHTSKIGGRADAPDPAAAFDDCLICAETFPLGDFCQVSCCRQKLCQTCVEKIIETKAQQASEILSFYLSRGDDSHQCPQCGCGPIEHFACSDLTESSHNRCPSCSFTSDNISAWPKWDGELCESLQAYEHGGKIDCPFCRKKCTLFLLGNNGSSRTRGKCGLQNANSVEMSMVPGFGNGRFSISPCWTTSEN